MKRLVQAKQSQLITGQESELGNFAGYSYWPKCVMCEHCFQWLEISLNEVNVEYRKPLYDSDDWVTINTDRFKIRCITCGKDGNVRLSRVEEKEVRELKPKEK
jgi:hypothetical protein